MGYTQFVIWAGKQGFKYGQKYLNKAWQEATKGGKQVLESQFPKLINKAEDLYKNFKGFDPKVVPKTKITPDKVTKIPTSYKTPPSTPKKEGIPIFGDPIQQQGLNFFRDLGKKQQGVYGPFGKGTDGFRNMMLWMMQNTPKKTMEVMKQYGYKPKVVSKMPPGKADGGRIDKPLPTRSRDI